MKLIGEVWQISCRRCKRPFQVVLEPQPHYIEPRMLPDDFKNPENIPQTSTVICPLCSHPVHFLGKLIFVVGDVEEFDEIEQHK